MDLQAQRGGMRPSFQWFQDHSSGLRMAMVPVLLGLVAAVYALVYFTGGIKYVYSHSMYVPIVLAGFVFGLKGGIAIGLLGGLTLGPFMPIDVLTGEAQQPVNWLYRTGFFTLIGFLSGAASDSARSYVNHIKWSARHDDATGLANRFALDESLAAMSRKARKAPRSGVLIVLHLENSDELSASFGHAIVDDVMCQIAERIGPALPDREAVFRLDSEKLAVLRVHEPGFDAERLLGDLAQRFRVPFATDGILLHGDVRMGCTTFEPKVDAPASILQRAQAALSVAGRKALDSAVFGPHMRTDVRENLERLGELKEALEAGTLTLHYQPKVLTATGEVHGVEALMRWNHPARGMIPPGKFIPRAELSTLIDPLTAFAVDHALAQLQAWSLAGMRLSMAVNISTRNLLQPNFADRVRERLACYGIAPDLLELEVTENALMVDLDAALAELSRLSGMNIVLSIDDFGTGYSSLQYLSELPVSLIKVDQSFVRKLPNDMGATHIVEAAVTLAHKVGLKVVAEGVENRETYDFLREIGCDLAQGYYIARPAPAQDFADWYAGIGGRFQ